MNGLTASPRSLLPPVTARRTSIIWAVGPRIQIAVGAGLGFLYLIALGAGQDTAATAIVAATACVAVVWPGAGLAMFALVMPMREPDLLVPVRFNAILAGAITFGCFLRLPIDRFSMRVHPGAVLLVGYLLYSAVSLAPFLNGLPSAWTPSALNVLLRLATGVGLFLSAIYLFRLMSPWPILGLALVGATIAALLAIGEILNILPFESLIGGLLEPTGGLRAGGAFADPNFLGVYMATAAVFAVGVFRLASRRIKVALVASAILLFTCVALAYSRGATLGVLAGILVLIWLRNRAVGLLLLIIAGVLVVTLYPVFLEARQGSVISATDTVDLAENEGTRVTMALAALSMFAAYPIFGVGFGFFQYVSPEFVTGGAPDSSFSHNQYLNILAEQGIVGVVMVGTLLVMLTVTIVRSTSPLRATALAMGVTYLVASLFLHTATVFQSSSLIWLVLAATLATRGAATEARGPT